jgi:multidrug efflux pump
VNIPALFINRPVATTLLAIAIGISGLLAYFHLPVAPLPNVTFPVIVVQANMAGASPEIMASTVAEPLERRLGTIAGVTELTSTNYVGSSMVVVQFALNRDINGAARDVQAAIQAARADLPTTLRNNPSYREYNPADSPIIILSLTSATLNTAQLYDSADTADRRRRSDPARRKRPAVGPGRTRARQAGELRHRPRGRARRGDRGECGQRQRPPRSGRSTLRGDIERPGDQGGGLS